MACLFSGITTQVGLLFLQVQLTDPDEQINENKMNEMCKVV